MQELDIIYEDKAVIVCHKPAGIPTQSPKIGQPDMVSILKKYLREKGEDPYVGLIQRLDQPVEGVIVFGKNSKVTASLSGQIREKSITKEYYAVVRGVPPQEEVLEDYLLRDGRTNTSRVVKKEEKGAKLARLSFKCLENSDGGRSLLHVKLETGRHHQIRVQLSHAGYPLMYDHKYGTDEDKAVFSPVGLCACHVKFLHPVTGKEMEFSVIPKGEAFKGFSFK